MQQWAPMVTGSKFRMNTSSPIQLKSPTTSFQGRWMLTRGLMTTPRPTRAPNNCSTARLTEEGTGQGGKKSIPGRLHPKGSPAIKPFPWVEQIEPHSSHEQYSKTLWTSAPSGTMPFASGLNGGRDGWPRVTPFHQRPRFQSTRFSFHVTTFQGLAQRLVD